MTKAKEIGDRIAQARRELGVREHRDVRPVEVARALGVSGAAVSDWEAGKATPRDGLMEKLAAYLGVTPEFLRYGVRASRVQLTPDEIAAAIARSTAEREARGLPPVGPDEVDADEDDPPARKAAGGRRRPKPPRAGK
jgi:transcriptional regulator with XRE-family HTH domain